MCLPAILVLVSVFPLIPDPMAITYPLLLASNPSFSHSLPVLVRLRCNMSTCLADTWDENQFLSQRAGLTMEILQYTERVCTVPPI